MASLRNKKLVISPGQEYAFPLNGDSVRLVSANVPVYFKTPDGEFDFYLNVGEKAKFDGIGFVNLIVYTLSGVDQAITISVGKGADIGSALVSGSVTISGGALDLNVTTLDSMRLAPMNYGATSSSVTNLNANTPAQIIAAAANINGVLIHGGQYVSVSTVGATTPSFIAKATPPSTVIDGDVIAIATNINILSGASTTAMIATIDKPIKIAAGKGVFVIAANAEVLHQHNLIYTIL